MQKRALDLLYGLVIKARCAETQIPYYPQKTEICSNIHEIPQMKLCSPESAGVSSEYITRLLSELEACSEHLHSIVILKNGKKIAEAAAPGYSPYRRHVTHSMAKTVTGLAIGMLIDEGKLSLSDKAYDILDVKALPALASKARSVTVSDLLTMRTHVVFNELGAVTEENWVNAFFSSATKNDPGSGFAYNSMNSYLLSAIVQKISGETLMQYLTPRLWEPLGITNVFWEVCPKGVNKGGWGLYISTEDMAKLGQLFLQRGEWNGKRIISADWLSSATSVQAKVSGNEGNFSYGYQLWVSEAGDGYLFNGMLGQNVWVCPETQWVIAFNSGTDEMFQHNGALSAAVRYSTDNANSSAKPIKRNRRALRALRRKSAYFMTDRTWIRFPKPVKVFGPFKRKQRYDIENTITALVGKWSAAENNIGTLPLFVRLIQNNHSEGIKAIEIACRDTESILVSITEGEHRFDFVAGLYSYCENTLDYYGELYRVAAAAQPTYTEDNLPVLKIELKFPEIANTRRIKLYSDGDKMSIIFSETPGVSVLERLLDCTHICMPHLAPIVGKLKPRLDSTALTEKFRTVFSPQLSAKKETVSDVDMYM